MVKSNTLAPGRCEFDPRHPCYPFPRSYSLRLVSLGFQYRGKQPIVFSIIHVRPQSDQGLYGKVPSGGSGGGSRYSHPPAFASFLSGTEFSHQVLVDLARFMRRFGSVTHCDCALTREGVKERYKIRWGVTSAYP